MDNIFRDLPNKLDKEVAQTIIKNDNVRIEKIISTGQKSEKDFWYDQDENEWVIVLKGSGLIKFFDGSETLLKEGDYLNIPKGVKHRVEETSEDEVTIWLCVFY
ncbi:MAG: cupin domain-containing protein [Campylobacterales bacterium]|nr:cupin domain-containing protein [Campylobacterales bacterium]